MTLGVTEKQAASLLQGALVDLVESVYAQIQLDNLLLTLFHSLSISSCRKYCFLSRFTTNGTVLGNMLIDEWSGVRIKYGFYDQ